MSKINLLFTFVVVSLLLSTVGQSSSCRNQEGQMNNASAQRNERLAVGVWGGEHIRLEVTPDEVMIEYDCAHGAIDQPVSLDAQGRFNVKGRFIRERAGPVPRDWEPVNTPVRYAGQVSGETLKLTVTVADTGESIGTFTLTSGSEGRLWKCR